MTTLAQAENVRVEFGPLVALRDVSFDLAGGQLLGLVGPNGAGKTTLLRVMAGLQSPTSGMARILGKPVLGEHEVVRHHVGFAPDTPPAYEDLTIIQFLRFIAGAYGLDRGESEERIDFWLEKLWLTDKRDAMIRTLSRGMRQRVTLARTFMPRPHVILLDEPLSGLDPAGRIQLRSVLGMLRDQGSALVVSSHILTDLEEVSTHIAIIEHGAILKWATAEAIHARADARRRYRVATTRRREECLAALKGMDGVSDVSANDGAIEFDFASEDDRAAALLASLVSSGIPVISFTPLKTSLEDMYMRAGVRQVD